MQHTPRNRPHSQHWDAHMAMTDRERILAYLRFLSRKAATKSEIQEATGAESHQVDLFHSAISLLRSRPTPRAIGHTI
jgi:hypothetical protein